MRTILLVALLAFPRAQQAVEGQVEVILRDAKTQEPIRGASIGLVQYKNPRPNAIITLTTDASGRAVFKNQPPGNYGITAEHDEYIRRAPAEALPHYLSITSDKLTHQVNLTLSRGAIVTGRVLLPDGTPITTGAQVQIYRISYGRGIASLAPLYAGSGPAPTDDRGMYRLWHIPPGEYYVRVDFRPEPRTASRNSLPRLTYYPSALDPRTATRVKIRDTEEIAGIDIRIPDRSVFKISGTLINSLTTPTVSRAGLATFAPTYFLLSADEDSLEDPLLLTNRISPFSPPGEASFEFDGIASGAYYLLSTVNSAVGVNSWTRTLLNVERRDLDSLRIVLSDSPQIQGRLTVSGNPSGIDWQSVRVGFLIRDRVPASLLNGEPTIIPDAGTGQFVLSGIGEGVKFSPVLTGLPPESYVADLRQGNRSVYNDGIATSASTNGPINVVIGLRGGVVRGVLHSTSSQILPGHIVALVPTARRANSMLYKRVATDANGEFRFLGVAPGAYKVFAWRVNPSFGGEGNAQFISAYESLGVPVTVTEGSTVTTRVTQIPAP